MTKGNHMAKFVLAYRGGGGAPDGPPSDEEMAKWMGWFGGLGAAVVDGGNPFARSTTLGGTAPGDGLTGYSVIDAADLDDAVAKEQGCPVLGNGGQVDVYEAIEM